MGFFSIGNSVTWRSQSQGCETEKKGEVVYVVPPYAPPGRERFPGVGFGSPRNHESYVVKVGNRHYWPRVNALRPQAK